MEKKKLTLEQISKAFGQHRVLDDVGFSLTSGEIHAIVGENGAGKSTLMNILFGMPAIFQTGGFSGTIAIDGKPISIRSPRDAMEAGIGMVHQEFMLLPSFTIAENVKINREAVKPTFLSRLFGPLMMKIDTKAMQRDTRQLLDQLHLDIDECEKVEGLPVGHLQFIEIAREIDKESASFLIFDEPTAVLTDQEVTLFLQVLRELSEKGIGILLITHHLKEIMEVADTITVLRDGKQVRSTSVGDTSIEEIARLMVGRTVDQAMQKPKKKEATTTAPLLSIRNLSVDMPGEMLRDFSLDVKKGEIIGIGGLTGQGKLAVSNGIMGIHPARGELFFQEEKMANNNPQHAIEKGFAFVSEERKTSGLLLDLSIEMNIAISALFVKDQFLQPWAAKWIDKKAMRLWAEKKIEEYDIRCTGPDQPVCCLSGGNQQKVCLARAVTLQPQLLLVSEPTRGIDVGAKERIFHLLFELNRQQGVTIILTSSELGELRTLCDRIAIVYAGKLSAILSPTASDTQFGLALSGKKE